MNDFEKHLVTVQLLTAYRLYNHLNKTFKILIKKDNKVIKYLCIVIRTIFTIEVITTFTQNKQQKKKKQRKTLQTWINTIYIRRRSHNVFYNFF